MAATAKGQGKQACVGEDDAILGLAQPERASWAASEPHGQYCLQTGLYAKSQQNRPQCLSCMRPSAHRTLPFQILVAPPL